MLYTCITSWNNSDHWHDIWWQWHLMETHVFSQLTNFLFMCSIPKIKYWTGYLFQCEHDSSDSRHKTLPEETIVHRKSTENSSLFYTRSIFLGWNIFMLYLNMKMYSKIWCQRTFNAVNYNNRWMVQCMASFNTNSSYNSKQYVHADHMTRTIYGPLLLIYCSR